MSPQRSNRDALINGALRCIEEKPSANITARDISAASGANLASIAYHFGSKDTLMAHAMEEGFNRWQGELAAAMGDLAGDAPAERMGKVVGHLQAEAKRHRGLTNAFLAALARAPHDSELREVLARAYAASRKSVAALLDLGEDQAAIDAAALLLATFDGLLIQALMDDSRPVEATAIWRGMQRLSELATGTGAADQQANS
jgi:AcrR family transcriptional regulator